MCTIGQIGSIDSTILIGHPNIYKKFNDSLIDDSRSTNILDILYFLTPTKINKSKLGVDKVKIFFSVGNIDDKIRTDLSRYIEPCCIYGSNKTNIISLGVPGSSKGLGVPILDLKIDKDTSKITVRGESVYKKKWFKTKDKGYLDRSGYLFLDL